MNLNHLKIFKAVAETGSITAGASKLLISQPAVSKQIRQFERELGTQLFLRGAKPLTMTEAGRSLSGFAGRIFALVREAEQAMEDLHHLRGGSLSIGASTTIGVYLLPDLLVRFRRKFPNVRLGLEIENGATLLQRLQDEVIDIALTEVLIEAPHVEAAEFMQDEFVAIVPHDHLLARRRIVTLAEFSTYPVIVRETGSPAVSFIERSLVSRGIRMKPALSLGSTEAIKSAVRAGLGVAIVPRLPLELELSTGRIAAVRVKDLDIKRPLYQYRLSGRGISKAATAFLCLLKHAARGTLRKLSQVVR